MKICNCTLPYLNPNACENCINQNYIDKGFNTPNILKDSNILKDKNIKEPISYFSITLSTGKVITLTIQELIELKNSIKKLGD
jgi:hypothetical protein